MEPVKLLERAVTGAAHAIRHPVSSAAYAVGMVRGLAGAVVSGATITGHDPDAGPEAGPEAGPTAGPTAGPAPVPGQRPALVADPAPPAAPAPPAPPGESFATEPTATSRQSAHGGRGDDAEVDDWAAEALGEPDVDVETPVGTTGAGVGHNPDTAEADLQQPGTEPLLDPATTKAIRSESEILRKAADPDPR